jgi:hypothetical protein
VSDHSTDALQTIKDKAGVCRDFSHVAASLCRALQIPARFVTGYLYELDPMDMHAWFEAFAGGRWYTFDATQKTLRAGRVVVAYGRDAADVAFLSNYAPMEISVMDVEVRLADPGPVHIGALPEQPVAEAAEPVPAKARAKRARPAVPRAVKAKAKVKVKATTGISLLQWPAMLASIVAAWLVGSEDKRRRNAGFWVFIASNVLWVVWGWSTQAWALVAMQFALGAMNIRGMLKTEK